MENYKEMLVLAHSVKHGEYCLAGKDIHDQKWIRPVSSTKGGELSAAQIQCKEHNAKPHGDDLTQSVVKFYYKTKCPYQHQTENYLVANKKKWELSMAKKDICNFSDEPKDLWGDSNKVPELSAKYIKNSLYLVRVKNLELYKQDRSKYQKPPQRRSKFQYNNLPYNLPATAIKFDSLFSSEQKFFPNAILCISLGENYKGNHYKLVAGIFSDE